MINIVLAAGYATRMYPLTENFPKPLLVIKGQTILDRLISDVDKFPEVERHIIVTNHKFFDIFEQWKKESNYSRPIEVIDDGSTCNDDRLGAVRDLLLAISKVRESQGVKTASDTDFMVLAADNMLDFSIRGFVDFFEEKQTSIIMCHYEPSIPALQKTGVVCLDNNQKVLLMEEKPHEPKSNWAVPPFYIYHHSDIQLIVDCLAPRKDGSVACGFDAPGNLAHYLCEASTMHAWPMPGHRIDIGDLQTYKKLTENDI